MQRTPDTAVVAWLDGQAAESVWITSITLFETRLGLALLPAGRRRQTLQAAFASSWKRIWRTEYSISTAPPQQRPRHLRLNDSESDGRWTCATRRLLVSRSRGAPR